MNTERFLLNHAKNSPVSFHMPGHKGSAFYLKYGHGEFLENFMDCDITEIPGADNLFHAEGILKKTARRYARLYDVDRTFLLVNGTSCGIIAAVLASVPQGGRIIMARNSHKSVYNALKLGKITPSYIYPEIEKSHGISAGFNPEVIENAIKDNPDAAAVILPSPNYYGICSDIKSIAEICHKEGKILIVDQAHGAHLHMMEKAAENMSLSLGSLPMSAETAGADLVIGSTHKTMASFTQSAILNKQGNLVDEQVIEDKLQMIESSSPSYLLMASMDINASIIETEGQGIARSWLKNINDFYEKANEIPAIRTIGHDTLLDYTKINIDTSRLGISGAKLEEELMKRNIFIELTTGNLLMCMSGIGTTKEHLERLYEALSDIASYSVVAGESENTHQREAIWSKRRKVLPAFGDAELVKLKDAAGRISAAQLIPYPPGIPLVCEGEIIDQDDAEYLAGLSGNVDVLGVKEGRVKVIKKVNVD